MSRRILAPLALAAAFTSVSCIDLPPGDWKSPQYWGDVFLNKYADELVVTELEPGPTPLAEPRTVLLITGVTIPAAWFDPMVLRLERDGFRPVVYEPPDLLSGDLFENSVKLGEVIAGIRAETGEDKIDILAECTGGLIVRHYIQSLGGDQYVSRMVTFISPQHGLPKAEYAAKYAGWPALYDLTPGSDFLEAVNSAPLPANVPVTSIYTCTDEYIQPYETSIIPGATNIGLCDEKIGHFQFFYDPEIYLVMHGALTEPLPAPTPNPNDPNPNDPNPNDPNPNDPNADDSTVSGCAAGGSSTGGGAASLLLLGAIAISARRRRRA